jgi:hypothetical protein
MLMEMHMYHRLWDTMKSAIRSFLLGVGWQPILCRTQASDPLDLLRGDNKNFVNSEGKSLEMKSVRHATKNALAQENGTTMRKTLPALLATIHRAIRSREWFRDHAFDKTHSDHHPGHHDCMLLARDLENVLEGCLTLPHPHSNLVYDDEKWKQKQVNSFSALADAGGPTEPDPASTQTETKPNNKSPTKKKKKKKKEDSKSDNRFNQNTQIQSNEPQDAFVCGGLPPTLPPQPVEDPYENYLVHVGKWIEDEQTRIQNLATCGLMVVPLGEISLKIITASIKARDVYLEISSWSLASLVFEKIDNENATVKQSILCTQVPGMLLNRETFTMNVSREDSNTQAQIYGLQRRGQLMVNQSKEFSAPILPLFNSLSCCLVHNPKSPDPGLHRIKLSSLSFAGDVLRTTLAQTTLIRIVLLSYRYSLKRGDLPQSLDPTSIYQMHESALGMSSEVVRTLFVIHCSRQFEQRFNELKTPHQWLTATTHDLKTTPAEVLALNNLAIEAMVHQPGTPVANALQDVYKQLLDNSDPVITDIMQWVLDLFVSDDVDDSVSSTDITKFFRWLTNAILAPIQWWIDRSKATGNMLGAWDYAWPKKPSYSPPVIDAMRKKSRQKKALFKEDGAIWQNPPTRTDGT